MENYDSRMAQRVWNRVWEQPQASGEGLGSLLLEESQALADYTRLSGKYPELKPLAAECRRSIACLRGLITLTQGRPPAPMPVKPGQEALPALLRRCCHQSLKAVKICEGRASDPEFGCIFTQLAEIRRRHSRVLLELMGKKTGDTG